MRRVPFKIRLRYSFLYHFHHVIIITIIIVIIIIIIFIIFSLCLSPFFSLPLSLSLALPSFPESVCEGFLLKISFGIRFLMIFIISSPSPSSSSYHHHHHIIIIIVIIIIITHTSDRHIQIFISGLYIFTFAFRSSYFEITSCLHIFGCPSRSRAVLSYHLQDFIMQLLLSQFYNLIYVRLQNFISPLSGQPSSSLNFDAKVGWGWGEQNLAVMLISAQT